MIAEISGQVADIARTKGQIAGEKAKHDPAALLLTGYLAATSRKLDKPLVVLIQSSSAAGKSSLIDAVLNLMPEEERIRYSVMTSQSLYLKIPMLLRLLI